MLVKGGGNWWGKGMGCKYCIQEGTMLAGTMERSRVWAHRWRPVEGETKPWSWIPSSAQLCNIVQFYTCSIFAAWLSWWIRPKARFICPVIIHALKITESCSWSGPCAQTHTGGGGWREGGNTLFPLTPFYKLAKAASNIVHCLTVAFYLISTQRLSLQKLSFQRCRTPSVYIVWLCMAIWLHAVYCHI